MMHVVEHVITLNIQTYQERHWCILCQLINI